jgi:transcription antitermination protein NusB
MRALSRRRAREVALQVLYSLDANPDVGPAGALTFYFDRFADADDDTREGESEVVDRSFVDTIVREVSERRPALDELLQQVSRNWRIERIARVERTILRMALYELVHRADIPPAVAINEAIELAKKFGAADAPAFVNGILDSALATLRK